MWRKCRCCGEGAAIVRREQGCGEGAAAVRGRQRCGERAAHSVLCSVGQSALTLARCASPFCPITFRCAHVTANTRSLREPILPHYVSLRSRYCNLQCCNHCLVLDSAMKCKHCMTVLFDGAVITVAAVNTVPEDYAVTTVL